MKRYYVLIGNFGSGKSEISLNMAINAAHRQEKTILVDLDIINPYFRSAERKAELVQAGVRLIHPVFAMTGTDVPSLPPDIYSAFVEGGGTVVFDVGGDPAGATALGQYRRNFADVPEESLHVLYVVNGRRPLSQTPDQVGAMLQTICARARLQVTGLINNCNLSGETTAEDLYDGYLLLKEVAQKTGIPVAYTTGERAALSGFMARAQAESLDKAFIGEPMEINIYIHRDWDRFTSLGV